MKQLSHLHIETGPGGWLKAYWRREAGPDNCAFVRFQAPKTKRHRWLPVAVQVARDSNFPWLSAEFLADVPLSRIDRAVNLSDVMKDGLRDAIDDETPAKLDAAFRRMYRDAPRHKLERPARGQRTDDFYRQVRLAYRQAIAAGRPPLKTMAEDSGIPQGTIARWVAEARDKGFLPETTAGKVSA